MLRDDEVEALEEPVECLAPDGIRDVSPERALQRMRLEQAAVEEGDPAERAGAAAPLGRRAVEVPKNRGRSRSR